MSDVSVWSYGGQAITGEYTRKDPADPDADTLLLDALATLEVYVVRPVSLELTLACCDPQTGYPVDEPPNPYRQLLQLENLDPVDVDQIHVDTQVATRPRLDTAVVRSWLSQVQEFECTDPGRRPGWSSIFVMATEAQIPDALDLEDGKLAVSYGSGRFLHPVHRAGDRYWLTGPLSSHPELNPFELEFANEGKLVSFELSTTWSLWAESDGPGRPALVAAMETLTRSGWEVQFAG